MNNLIDQIDAYLDGTLSPADKTSFETQLASDESLRQALEVQKNLRAGIERLGMKAATASTFKKMTLKSKLYKWGVATVAVTAIATSIYYGVNSNSSSIDDSNITYELPATNENGGTDWADADRNLPTQLFEINPNKDTVIETMNGLVFAIPAGAFLNATDPITLEIREAVTPMDIMKAGLSTTSNGELLETGGMFYLNARNGETSLKINPDKPVYANVPTNEIRPGMQLFDGERKPDGSINWVNPKQIEKQLIPVDIFSLNFYPEGFLDKVAELGFDANDKKVTDSIYYSYAGRSPSSIWELMDGTPSESDWDAYGHYIGGPEPDGAALFKANCSSCHTTTDKKSTGPALRGVLSRIPGGDWKYDWVHNSAELIKSGDLYANKIYSEYKSVQTMFPKLTNQEIDAILAFADHGGKPYGMEIDPARIAAIWSPEFQNTIIATKEFEERLQVIFETGNATALDMYVNNLDKKLWEIDSMVMSLSTEIDVSSFQDFYKRHDGGVAVSQSHMRELQEYYQKKQEAVGIASEKTYNEKTADQRKLDSAYYADQNFQITKENEERNDNLTKEYQINLDEACEQLGIDPKTFNAPSDQTYYGVTVQTPGWKNIDAYVNEATFNRNSMNFTDSTSGKTATLTYESLQINIPDASSYSQLMVYLVTDSLPCFMRINSKNGVYSEKLNSLLEYSLVVLAEKNGIWFFATTPKVTPGSVNVTLQQSDEGTLRSSLNSQFSGKVGGDFSNEMNYMKETRAFNVRQEKVKEQRDIDLQIMEVIYPFAPGALDPCQSATKTYNSMYEICVEFRDDGYRMADELKAATYVEALKVENSFQNPLEKAAKKADADRMRAAADQAWIDAKALADKTLEANLANAKLKMDQACASGGK